MRQSKNACKEGTGREKHLANPWSICHTHILVLLMNALLHILVGLQRQDLIISVCNLYIILLQVLKYS